MSSSPTQGIKMFIIGMMRRNAVVVWLVVSIVAFALCVSLVTDSSVEEDSLFRHLIAGSTVFMLVRLGLLIKELHRRRYSETLYELLDNALHKNDRCEYLVRDAFHVQMIDDGECYWVEMTPFDSLEVYVFCVTQTETQAFTKVLAEIRVDQLIDTSAVPSDTDLTKGIQDEKAQLQRLTSSLENYLWTRPQT